MGAKNPSKYFGSASYQLAPSYYPPVVVLLRHGRIAPPRHPLEKYHQSQLDLLAALPEAQRAYHARLFRLGNASYRSQQQAAGEVTEDDFRHWLEGLAEKMRVVMERDGFEASKNSQPLRRHALERRDLGYGYDAFLQAALTPEDCAYQQKLALASARKH